MPLPKLADATTPVTVDPAPGITVTFNVGVVSGRRYNLLLEQHRAADGRIDQDSFAVALLEVSVRSVYSSIESTPVEFTRDDAVELWDEWPEAARGRLLATCVALQTKGPDADPFAASR